MALKDTEIRAFRPLDKPYRKADSGGLYLEVFPNGSKLWRWKFRVAGKEKRLALGAYPAISLKDARLHIAHAAEVPANPPVRDVRQALEFDVVQIDALDIPAIAIRTQGDANASVSARIAPEHGCHVIKGAKVLTIIRAI